MIFLQKPLKTYHLFWLNLLLILIDPITNTTSARIVSGDPRIFGMHIVFNHKETPDGKVVPDLDSLQVMASQELVASIQTYTTENYQMTLQEFYADCLLHSDKFHLILELYEQIPMARAAIGLPQFIIEQVQNNGDGTINLTFTLSFSHDELALNPTIPNYTSEISFSENDANLLRILSAR